MHRTQTTWTAVIKLQPAGDSDQYQNADKSDNANTTVDGCRYSMSTASRGRTSVMSRPAGRRRSTRTAADRSGMPVDRRVWHCRNRVVTKPATGPRKAPPAWGHSSVCCGSVEEQQSSSTQSSRRVTSWRCRSPDRCPDPVRRRRGL